MKKISFIVAILMVLTLALAGCAQTDEAADTQADKGTEGADSTEAGEISISGSTSVYPAMEEIVKMYGDANPNVVIDLQAGGSSVGVKQAAAGEVELGMASRDLKDEEISENEGIEATVLCLDGVAIVVNKANGVEDLTKDQVKAMYTGEITNWKDVGGADMAINLVTRDEASGTREAFEGLFLGKDDAGEKIEIDETICAAVVNSNGAVAKTVGGDEGAIGYMSLGIVSTYDTIKATKVGGVEATTDNVKNGSYSYYRNFNLITIGAPEGLVAALIDFCKTVDVVSYLEEKGYVMPQ